MNRILDHKKRANESQGGFFPLKPELAGSRSRRSGISALSSESLNDPCAKPGLFTGDGSVLPQHCPGSGCRV